MNCATPTPHQAFTLIELLVVIAIVAILAALVMAGSSRMIDNGKRAQCLGNLSTLGKGFTSYMGDNELSLPPKKPTGEGAQDWLVNIADYIPYSAKVYICPANPTRIASTLNTNLITSYAINTYLRDYPDQFPMFRPKISPLYLPAPSKVGLLIDGNNGWLKETQPDRIAFVHRGDANVLFLDGHVQTLVRDQLVDSNNKVPCMGRPDQIR